MAFNTVLYQLRSAKNIGMIARSHLSFGGNLLIIIGNKEKWNFKGGSSTYTRKLIKENKIIFFDEFDDFLQWNNTQKLPNIAIEIDTNSCYSDNYNFPIDCNLILGNERTGLSESVLAQCNQIVTIPQSGNIGSLNVAVSASILFYEWHRQNGDNIKRIIQNKFSTH